MILPEKIKKLISTTDTDFEYLQEIFKKHQIVSDYKKIQTIIDNLVNKIPQDKQEKVLNYLLTVVYKRFEDNKTGYLKTNPQKPDLAWPLMQSTIILLNSGAKHRKTLSHIDFKENTIKEIKEKTSLHNVGLLGYALKSIQSNVTPRNEQNVPRSSFLETVLNEFNLEELKEILTITPNSIKSLVEEVFFKEEAKLITNETNINDLKQSKTKFIL